MALAINTINHIKLASCSSDEWEIFKPFYLGQQSETNMLLYEIHPVGTSNQFPLINSYLISEGFKIGDKFLIEFY